MRKTIAFVSFLLLASPLAASAATGHIAPAQMLDAYPPGVRFDPLAQRWSFYGVVDRTARYEIPAVTIDLARVTFRSRSGDLRSAWIALGVEPLPGGRPGYYALGPWSNSDEALRAVWERPVVQVSVGSGGRFLSPAVSPQGIDWSPCLPTPLCRFAATLDEMHMGLSNQFVRYEDAPDWYPWGFLFWEVSP